MSSLKSLLSTLQLPSPLESFELKIGSANRKIWIKRDDLIHSDISGNKWRKLKGHITHYFEGEYDGIVSYGGAFSNHLHALAAVCEKLKIPVKGVIRTNQIDTNNPTLKSCSAMGMQLISVAKDLYAKRFEQTLIHEVGEKRMYVIPEGGAGEYCDSGCKDILSELSSEPDYIVLPIGTGSTMYSLSKVVNKSIIIGISPFKKDKVYIPHQSMILSPHTILFDYALNGFGKWNQELIEFMNSFWQEFGIELDPVYNAKAMMGLFDLIEKSFFPDDKSIMYIHTGGLQGILGFNYLHDNKAPILFSRNTYSLENDL
jgi:1-aminocyclopropane-1-carboxylate deaminase